MRDKGLMAGSSEMMVLKLLSEADMYGYQITDELRRRSQNVFEMKAGTLYPLLHTLESKGYVTVYESTHDGRVRKYYSITKEGSKALSEKTESWREFSAAVEHVMAEVAYA